LFDHVEDAETEFVGITLQPPGRVLPRPMGVKGGGDSLRNGSSDFGY
jgi:hypothetical protein